MLLWLFFLLLSVLLVFSNASEEGGLGFLTPLRPLLVATAVVAITVFGNETKRKPGKVRLSVAIILSN